VYIHICIPQAVPQLKMQPHVYLELVRTAVKNLAVFDVIQVFLFHTTLLFGCITFCQNAYGLALVSRIDKSICLFFKRDL